MSFKPEMFNYKRYCRKILIFTLAATLQFDWLIYLTKKWESWASAILEMGTLVDIENLVAVQLAFACFHHRILLKVSRRTPGSSQTRMWTWKQARRLELFHNKTREVFIFQSQEVGWARVSSCKFVACKSENSF